MKPSELDKANGKYQEEWMPEVGQLCLVNDKEVGWCRCKILAQHPNNVNQWWYEFDDVDEQGIGFLADFKPIQTEADRKRDAEINEMAIIAMPNGDKDKDLLHIIGRLWDAGVRYVSATDGEYVVKRLSRKQITNLLRDYPVHDASGHLAGYADDLIDAVQCELGIIEEGLSAETKEFLGALGKW